MDTKSRTNDFANFTRSYMGEEEEKRRKRRVARMYAKQRQVASNAWNGGSRNNLRTHARTHTHVYIYICTRLEKGESRVKEDGRGGCRLYTVADSLGPEDISQRGWSRSDPESCLVLKPPPLHLGAKASPLLGRQGCSTRNKPVELGARDPPLCSVQLSPAAAG